jgi:hypothetical protein
MTDERDVPDDDMAEPDAPDSEGLRNTKRTRDQVAGPASAGRRTRESGEGERRTREAGGQ